MFSGILRRINLSIDWFLLVPTLFISAFGILTLYSFLDSGVGLSMFYRQLLWVLVALFVMIIVAGVDWRFLRRGSSIFFLYILSAVLLIALLLFGSVFNGAKSWFNLGFFAFQPVDIVKIIIILVLAKYFSRRHIDIYNIRHIIASGLYVAMLFGLVILQPDFGSAIILLLIWLFMLVFSGISKKQILTFFLIGVVAFGGLWFFGFKQYQKDRIISFLHPRTDIHGIGYSAYQAKVAIGSGEMFGRGVGLGSQSKLKFLPEYETDFIFAAFSEEWGFIGGLVLFALYGTMFARLILLSMRASTNFESLFGLGFLAFVLSHFVIHVGMNLGLLPITGITLPFMSYGGSHTIAEFIGLGIIMSQVKYSRQAHQGQYKNEIVGVV